MNTINSPVALPDLAIYEVAVTGEVTKWSEAARGLLGFSSQEVIGRHLAEMAALAASTAAASAIEEANRVGKSESYGLLVRKDGSRFWAHEVTLPLHDKSGETNGFARVVREATSWQRGEQERDRFFKMSGDLISLIGFDGYFKRINPAWSNLLGYSEEHILATPYINFVHPDDVAATIEEDSANERNEGDAVIRTFQNRYRRSDGTYVWLDWKVKSDIAEQLIYCIARDSTEHRATAQKLNRYAEELERSNVVLRQFAYVASHDLQEPLRAVAGCVQMLDERTRGTLDDQSSVLMKYAIDGARRMQTLISDLLEYSRLGSTGTSKVPTEAGPIIANAMRQVEVAIAESDAAITVGPMPHIFADPLQMTQLFQNLIANAIKFRGEGRPEIRITAEQAVGAVIFSVKDNGIGIAPEYHEQVFGVFRRLNARHKYTGTGIGLAICKKIVELHGGKIWIESKVGEGANFKFSIAVEMKIQ